MREVGALHLGCVSVVALASAVLASSKALTMAGFQSRVLGLSAMAVKSGCMILAAAGIKR